MIESFPTETEIKALVEAVEAKARAGDLKAQLGCAQTFKDGLIVPQDIHKARRYYQMAAEQDDPEAQFLYGKFLLGIVNDDQFHQPFEWVYKSAINGYLEAQAMLSYFYQYGHGVEQSYEKATYWTRTAAENGLASAQTTLGQNYIWCELEKKDFPKAVYWLQKATDQGDQEAMFALAELYEGGYGVAKDLIRAYVLYIQSSNQHPEAIDFAVALRDKMSDDEISKAEALLSSLSGE